MLNVECHSPHLLSPNAGLVFPSRLLTFFFGRSSSSMTSARKNPKNTSTNLQNLTHYPLSNPLPITFVQQAVNQQSSQPKGASSSSSAPIASRSRLGTEVPEKRRAGYSKPVDLQDGEVIGLPGDREKRRDIPGMRDA